MKRVLLTALLCAVVVLFGAAYKAKTDVTKAVFRLHVIANSDSEEDQKLKLSVRDALLSVMQSAKASTKAEAMAWAKENKAALYHTAQRVIRAGGYAYPVSVSVGKAVFPAKRYDRVTLPGGRYDALTVTIGKGGGKNWWCVLYPPLCLSAAQADGALETLKSSLTKGEYRLITGPIDGAARWEWKLLELF